MKRAELEQVRALIHEHDKWHREINEVIFPEGMGMVNLSEAYADSTLYGSTCAAIAILNAELAADAAARKDAGR